MLSLASYSDDILHQANILYQDIVQSDLLYLMRNISLNVKEQRAMVCEMLKFILFGIKMTTNSLTFGGIHDGSMNKLL